MRMIDADEVRNQIDDKRPGRTYEDAWALTILDNSPTVDAEPVRHGQWMPYEFGDERWRKCSVCGVADKYKNSHGIRAIRKYCPNCGAKMDGGEDDV